MSFKKVYEDKDKVVYEKVDDMFIFGTGKVTYVAEDKRSSAKATGNSVGEARASLEQGKSRRW